MLLEELGARIRNSRVKLGLTQKDVAGVLQVSPQAVSKWERGENAPDITLIPQLTRLLSVSSDRLLGTHIPSERTIEATTCFADIDDYTTRASGLSAEDVATMVNAHYFQLTEMVLKYDGIPVKYIGDEFLYFFAGPEHRLRSIRSAVNAMVLPGFTITVGMCSGPIFVGKIGHPDYAQMDVMGDYVNLAARTQMWTRRSGARIGATDSTVDGMEDIVQLGLSEQQEIKGMKKTVTIYEVKGIEE